MILAIAGGAGFDRTLSDSSVEFRVLIFFLRIWRAFSLVWLECG